MTDDAFEVVRKSWGFPAFARDFPRDPELDALVAAFARGDHAAVRVGAPVLAEKAELDEVKRAARLLRERIEPDPSSRLFFVLTGVLLVFLMAWWATHDGSANRGAPLAKPPPPPVEFPK